MSRLTDVLHVAVGILLVVLAYATILYVSEYLSITAEQCIIIVEIYKVEKIDI